MSSLRILYSPQNLAELFQVELKVVKNWTRIGILPSLTAQGRIMYLKEAIDQWLLDGNLEKHRLSVGYTHRKGVY